MIGRMEQQLAAGDREGVLVSLMRDVAMMPAREIELMRAKPAWQGRLAAVSTVPRELHADDAFRLDPAWVGRVSVPTLLVLGGASPAIFQELTNQLHEALPDNRVLVLPGQGHAAMDTAPELFVRGVVDFAGH